MKPHNAFALLIVFAGTLPASRAQELQPVDAAEPAVQAHKNQARVLQAARDAFYGERIQARIDALTTTRARLNQGSTWNEQNAPAGPATDAVLSVLLRARAELTKLIADLTERRDELIASSGA